MQGSEPAFDLDAVGIDRQRLGVSQRRRLMAFLADSARYLGLRAAGGGRPQVGCCAGPELLLEDPQLSAGVRGC